MATDLKTLTTDALATILTAQPNLKLTVVASGNTADGFKDSVSSEPSLTENGETGVTTGRVWCNYASIGTIAKGQSITVGGTAVFALRTEIDPAGALIGIDYSEQRPIKFSADPQ